MAQTITIELRVDFDSENKKLKEPQMIEIAREKAKELLTMAMLISDKRQPQMSFQCGDLWSSTEELKLSIDEQV